MAKKRDSKGPEDHSADGAFRSGVLDPRAFEGQGTSFAGMQGQTPGEEDIEAWDDEETAPDLFAGASDEDQMPSSGGQDERSGQEPGGNEGSGLRRR